MSLVLSILVIGFIILIHELGHFVTAKAFGVSVVEFSLGMGPVLISKTAGGTKYSLRLLPFGGSCMMLGEENDESEKDVRKLNELNNGTFAGNTVTVSSDTITVDGRTYGKDTQFYSKKAWQRFLIIFAGPLFNMILAFLFSVIFTARVGWDPPLILAVENGSPAYEAGIREGAEIRSLKVSGIKTKTDTSHDILLFFTANESLIAKGNEIEVEYNDADGNPKKGAMTAVYDKEAGAFRVGLTYSLAYQPCRNAGEVIKYAYSNVIYTMKATAESLRMMFRGDVNRHDVKGIVGMVAVMDENVEYASDNGTPEDVFLTLINLLVLISGTLGIMNLLPLPALDGGRIVFILIEMITGHAVPKKIEGYIHGAGMILLLMFMVLVMFNDVINLFR